MNKCLTYMLLTLAFGSQNSGCSQASRKDDFRPLAAATVAIEEAAKATPADLPEPAPQPTPTGQCSNCKGTGKLGDGRVTLSCPVCGGTGKSKSTEPPIEKPKSEPSPLKAPRVQCLIFVCEACTPCHALRSEIEAQLVPIGWKVGESADCVLRFVRQEADPQEETKHFQVRTWPTVILRVEGREVTRIVGRISAVELSRRMVVLQKTK